MHADGDDGLGPNATCLEVVGELIGAGIQLTISELLLAEDHGEGVWIALGLGLKQLGNCLVVGISGLGIIPLEQKLLSFGFCEQWQFVDRLSWIVHDRRHQA